MNKLNNFFLMLVLVFISAASLHAQTQTPVAVYTGVCGSQYYRIPAIVTANNGDLLFFNDDRKNNNSDVGRRDNSTDGIDLLVKRLSYNSTNGSYTTSFTSSQNITPNKSQSYYCYGDPAVVVDRESSNVLVLTIGGEGASTNVWYKNKTSFVIKSADNGQTWSSPVQVSLPTITDNSSVTGFFFASGRILQSKVIKKQGASFYRIYSALLYTGNNNGTGPNYNKVFYSDDFGTTWNLLGGTYAQTSADEAKLEELSNGDLILTTRKGGGRYINKFTYTNTATAAGSWGSYGLDYAFTGGCAINGDMLTMTAYRTSDNQEVTLLLQSTATGTPNSNATTYDKNGRYNIKIFYHEIDNNTTAADLTSGWTATTFTLPNTSVFGGYSAMTLQADDKIGVYYEGNTSLCASAGNDFSNLYYIAYTLEQLTGNAYTLTDPNPPVVVVPDVEVPDGVVPIYEWHGTNSPYWNDPLNWTVVNAINNAPLARATVPTLPATNSNVKILAPGTGEYNPVLTAATSVANLYVAPGAALGGQHYLTITGRVFTDVEIPSNQWVRMCMPLSNTYSGDMFTAIQGGKILNGTTVLTPNNEDYYFTGATYDPVDGGGDNAHNRKFPYSIYQRVFADAVNVMNDDIPDETRQFNSEWSVPYNDLAARFQDAQGFDLWSPSTESVSMFRFPSVTDTYQYYTNNGTPHTTRSETVSHAASGTMAYGASNNGVKDVTLTRNKRSDGTGTSVPMYAVGNPSFAYMDIAEFIRVNAYGASHSGNASVVGNITPYVYKYNENNPGTTGEASETIYFLDNNKDLYTVSATVSDNTIPSGGTTTQVAANSTEKYIAPTRGFRVMAGQAEVSAVEPKLIGNYSTSDFKIAPMRYGTTTALTGGTNTYSYISSLAPNSTGEYTTTLTISLGSSPDEVIMNGFCVSNVLVGKVDPIAQTITVKGGSVVGWQTDNANWKTPANTSSYTDSKRPTNRHIYAWDGTSKSTTSERIGPSTTSSNYYYTEYASGLSADDDIVFDYTINSNGQISITCRSGFAIYTIADNNANVNGVTSRDYPISYLTIKYDNGIITDYNYPLTFNVYESFSATTTRTTTEDNYICPEMFGTYKYKIGTKSGANSDVPASNTEHSFSILPIEGAYDVVRITDFYAGTNTDYSHDGILGYITPSGSTYTLTIPSAQVVAYGSTGQFSQYRTLYKRKNGEGGRSADPNILTWNADEKVLIMEKRVTGYDQFQISGYDANGNSYLAEGLSVTIQEEEPTEPSGPTATEINAVSIQKNLLLYNNDYYLSVNASGTQNAVNNQTNALNNNDCYFQLESASYSKYYIKNSNGWYLKVTTSGSGNSMRATTSWVQTSSNATSLNVDVQSDGFYVRYSTTNSKNFYFNINKNNLQLLASTTSPGTISLWKFYEVTPGSTSGGSTTVTALPQTAPYSGGSSTTDPTVGQFEVGTNYEAINLKYTPAMFNANPGYTPSASSAPRKTAAQGSAMASVTLKEGNRTANTLITRRDNANNGYNAFEDASLIDMADNAKSIATLAGNQMVAVNTLGDTTAVQLVINNVSGNFTLDVDNISALGSNARLYDAVNATEQPIDGNHQTLTLNMSVNDSPLRYSIRWDVATGTEDIELPNGNSDVWFQAFGGNGTIRVNSNNVMSQVRLFDAAGKEIARRSNQGYETSFNALQPGVYMVEATDGQTTKTIKVSVK